MTHPELPSIERIELLLLRILEVPESERATALELACEEAPELAPRLHARLNTLSRLGLLEVRERCPSDPQHVGPYRIVARLGAGGMGIVHLAEHESLGRRVALKCIQPELLSSERARERFRREALVNGRLQHPGIATLYEAGIDAGRPFLAMQLVEGEPLDEQLRRARAQGLGAWRRDPSTGERTPASGSGSGTPLPRRSRLDAVQLVAELADAVQALHAAGFVHRDLKPANVMVTRAGRPVLIDLGLARDLAEEAAQLTQSGDLIGTPAYMAPEQVEPRGRPQDARTDVHALGAILYELLTLRPPFAGESREDTYRRILSADLIDVRRLQPSVSRDLAAVVQKALAREPRRRFGTAQELADELRRVLTGTPTLTRPPGMLHRAVMWAKRQPAVAASVATLFASLAIGLVFALALLRQERAAVRIHQANEATFLDPAVGAVLAAEALDADGGEPARSAVYRALTELRLLEATPTPNSVVDLATTPETLAVGCFGGRNDTITRGLLMTGDEAIVHITYGRPRAIAIDFECGRALYAGHLLRMLLLDLDGRVIAEPITRPEESWSALQKVPTQERIPYGIVSAGMQAGTVFSITRDGWVRHFDAQGEPDPKRSFQVLPPPGGWLCGARGPRDGALAFGGKDGTIAVHEADGRERWRARHHAGQVRVVAFSPDGTELLSAAGHRRFWRDIDEDEHHRDHAPKVLAASDGAVQRVLAGHSQFITDACWSGDGRYIATTSEDRTARIWSLSADLAVACVPHEKAPDHCSFFPDGQRLLTTMRSGEAVISDIQGRQRTVLRGHRGGANVARPVGRSEQVVSGSMDYRLLRWDASSRWVDERWSKPRLVHAVLLDDALWTVSLDGIAEVWGAPKEPEREIDLSEAFEPGEYVAAAALWRERDRFLISTSRGRLVALARDGAIQELRRPRRGEDPPEHLLAHGESVLLRTHFEQLVIWSPSGELPMPPCVLSEGHPDVAPETKGIGVSAAWHGDRVAVGTDLSFVLFGSSADRSSWTQSERLDSTVMGVSLDPGAASAVAATRDGYLWRVDAAGMKQALRPSLNVFLHRMVESPDGELLAVSGSDKRARILDRSGQLHLTLPPLGAGICCMGFSPDRQRFFAASYEGEIKIWRLYLDLTGEELLATSPYQSALEEARRRPR
jgi:serine/threonine protein kinase/WD40 repeat protein